MVPPWTFEEHLAAASDRLTVHWVEDGGDVGYPRRIMLAGRTIERIEGHVLAWFEAHQPGQGGPWPAGCQLRVANELSRDAHEPTDRLRTGLGALIRLHLPGPLTDDRDAHSCGSEPPQPHAGSIGSRLRRTVQRAGRCWRACPGPFTGTGLGCCSQPRISA